MATTTSKNGLKNSKPAHCPHHFKTYWPHGEVYWRVCGTCGCEQLVDMSHRADWVLVDEVGSR